MAKIDFSHLSPDPIVAHLETLRETSELTFVIKQNKSGIARFIYYLTHGDQPVLQAFFFWRQGAVICVGRCSDDGGGASGAVHGGLITTMIDQVMGIASFGSGVMGVTLNLQLNFHKFIPLNRWFQLTARIGQRDGDKFRVTCTVHEPVLPEELAGARVYVTADALFLQRNRKILRDRVGSVEEGRPDGLAPATLPAAL